MTRAHTIAIAALALAACGSPDDGADGADGSSCTVEQRKDGAYLTCGDGTEALAANGADGQNGVPGADGADGADGRDGVDGASARVASSLLCIGVLSDTAMLYTYQAVTTEAGDVFVSAGVSDGATQSTGSFLWSATQQAAGSRYAQAIYDGSGADNYGWFEMRIVEGDSEPTIIYHDSDNTDDRTWLVPADDCTTHSADEVAP